MGASQRRKGASGERELAEILTKALGIAVKRKLGAARDGGDDIETPGISWECKRHEKLAIEPWLQQAVANRGKNTPVVAFRRNNQPWTVALRLDDFLTLLRKETK